MRLWTISGCYINHDDKRVDFETDVIARDGDAIEPVVALKEFLADEIKGGFTIERVERFTEYNVISKELVDEIITEHGRDVEG